MRAFVFTDRALERYAGRFVWLSIDAENSANAGFLARYPVEAYPTLFVVDPGSERAVLRWIGGASVAQLTALLEDGAHARAAGGTGADAALARADRLLGAGKDPEAAVAYREALAIAADDWPGRDRAVEALLTILGLAGDDAACVETARAESASDRTAHGARVAGAGLGCAAGLEGDARATAVAAFEPAVRAALADPGIDLPADDRSGLWDALVSAREAVGDASGARDAARGWLGFLEAEAGRAASPEERTVFDSHRLSAALAAGEPARAIPALERSERDFPRDYNPPARLAVAYAAIGRLDDAEAAARRALERVYGPRKLRVYWTLADVLEKKGESGAARQALEDARRFAASLPEAQRPTRTLAAIERRIAQTPSGP